MPQSINMPLPCESWPLVILVNFTCLWQCQGYSRQWESENICRWSMPVVYMLKCSLGLLMFPMDFLIAMQWKSATVIIEEVVLFFAMQMVRYLMYVHFFSVKKPEFVLNVSYWPVIDCVCVVLSVLHSSPDGWRLLKKERFMKMKAKSYTQAHTITHIRTHIHLAPPPSFPRSVLGGHLFRKAKRGLSVYFTLEIKWGFKWWPLTRGHICSVTNFTPPSSPDGSPAWPHPGNLWLPFAWTKREEGRVFRLTEITCLHKRNEGLITITIKRDFPQA